MPGEDLALYSTPLFVDTTLNGQTAFAPRFWDDGTARLTAYEYQGYTQSRCATEGGLTCNDCHAMHEGDPRGQLRPSAAGDAMCTRCHGALSGTSARLAHVAPSAERGGSAVHARVACVECHMPRVVYGLRAAHRSHRIDSPPRSLGVRTSDRLDACALCHLDGTQRARGGAAPIDDLFAGDPIQRAIVASALGRHDSLAPQVGFTRPARLALLLEVMRDDRYPGVRSVAWSSARAIAAPEAGVVPTDFVPTEGGPQRALRVAELARRLGVDVAPPLERAILRARASERAIEIGE